MRDDFNLDRTISICKRVISEAGENNRINYNKLLKIVYMVERQTYESYRSFIMNDEFSSMSLGIIPSGLLSLIEGKKDIVLQEEWDKHFKTEGYDLIDKGSVHENRLTREQNIVADVVIPHFKEYGWEELVELSNELCGEYDPSITGDQVITKEDIANNVYPQNAEEIWQRINS